MLRVQEVATEPGPSPGQGAVKALVGTAGWSIPRDTAHAFPDVGAHLDRYARAMPAVEINSSFHRPHGRATYERWAAATPESFRFSVKIPKDISHTRRLTADALAPLETFVEQIGGLGGRLGVVLLQLPPSLAFDPAIAGPFLETLRRLLDPEVGIACEPRHATWFGLAADGCLENHRVARVAADPVLAAGGEFTGGWAGLRYHRFHGSPRVYYSSYATDALESVAARMEASAGTGGDTWCIFDNTASGAATTDALRLLSLITPSPDQKVDAGHCL